MKNLGIMKNPCSRLVPSLLLSLIVLGASLAQAHVTLPGHVPAAARSLLPIGSLPQQNKMNLAFGLPIRDQAGLTAFLQELADPNSPNYRQYLTPQQFVERFGPTEQDYQNVINFAQAHGLSVTATHPNRMVLDVSGTVADVERTFHITLRTYQHPTENRTFFAPDVDPSIDQAVPILDVSGLDNYSLPHPNLKPRPDSAVNPSPKVGSGPSGSYIGNDFRNAYAPGVSLKGSGQAVGLLEFAGYNASAITAYESQAGLSSMTLQNVLIDGYNGAAGSGEDEVCLDIEVAMAMAPGLSKVIVYEAPNPSPWVDILNRMANDNSAKQLSCSWGGGSANATAEQIFQQMASQGQSFFNATGDSDAYTGSIPFPSDSPNITEVGGTTLTTLGSAAYSSETTWNWGGGTGSSGGISTVYSIPSWQQGVSMANNQGSTTKRNLPDVALTADNVYVVHKSGTGGIFGGTSCAAPLWAGFTALVNQQAVANSQSPVGFLNPALYTIGKGGNYTSCFHDTTTGNNITNQSNGKFSAVTGYDLCTGWGTPNGANMINALSGTGGGGTNYTVSTSSSPANGGTTTGAGSYAAGSSVTVTATAKSGFTFSNWTENGSVVSSSASYTFTINANRTLVANFTSNQTSYTITLSASPLRGGTVSGAGTFPAGSTQTVVATPNGKFHFVSWNEKGVSVSNSASYTFTLSSNRTLVAKFAKP